jgi:hypothetical protein
MNYNTLKKAKNQRFLTKIEQSPQVCQWQPPKVQPLDYFQIRPAYEQSAFDVLLQFHRRGDKIHFSQAWFAKINGFSRKTANKKLGEWADLGFINKEYRHRNTCIYTVNPYFDFNDVVSKLRHVFRAFKISAFLLVAACYMSPVTPSRIKSKYVFHGIKKVTTYNQKNRINDLVSYELRDYDVSLEQKITLSAFPDDVLSYALFHFHAKRKVLRSPYSYIFKLCWDYSNRKGLPPDWQWKHKIQQLQTLSEQKQEINNEHNYNPPVAQTPPRFMSRHSIPRSLQTLLEVSMKNPVSPRTQSHFPDFKGTSHGKTWPAGLLSRDQFLQTIAKYREMGIPEALFIQRQLDLVAKLPLEEQKLWQQD